MIWVALSALSLALWGAVLLAPWQAWRTCERLEAKPKTRKAELGDVTVLVPARDEAAVIGETLRALRRQGRHLNIIVIDDHSTDGTAAVAARAAGGEHLTVLQAKPLPSGWSGKLWALQQGLAHVRTPYVLLLDADITLKPDTLASVYEFAGKYNLALVSLMPAFIYFFKLVYPFRLANSKLTYFAAAAGGCVLIERQALRAIGGFASIRAALIDDCTLAACVKAAGLRTWIGLTHAALSRRRYERLDGVWEMVARSAFAQLCFSTSLLVLCTLLMGAAFWLPVAALFFPVQLARVFGCAALIAMAISYVPTLYFYQRSLLWVLALPLVGTLYLAMTWHSAWRYWSGAGARWKGRAYGN